MDIFRALILFLVVFITITCEACMGGPYSKHRSGKYIRYRSHHRPLDHRIYARETRGLHPTMTGDDEEENDDDVEKLTETTSLPPCDPEQLMKYLVQMQSINPESVVNLASKQDIIKLCKTVSVKIDTVDSYLHSCSPPHEKAMFMQLIQGVFMLYEKLCLNKKFQKEFMKHSSCFVQVHNEYDDCMGPINWSENPDKKDVCKSFKNIADCYYVKSVTLCGKAAAHVMKRLMKWIIESIITVECENIDQDPYVPDAMPIIGAKSGASEIRSFSILLYEPLGTFLLLTVFFLC